jgi:holliday junction DNA helicase RuvA
LLSPNSVALIDVGLARLKTSHPLTGPIQARPKGLGIIYEFIAPVGSWDWNEQPEFFRLNDCVDLHLHCEQSQTNGQTWYAFRTRPEKQMALLMATVDKVGVKTAVKILAATSYLDVQKLIDAGDRESFKKLPGIGPKTGEKLIAVLFVDRPIQPESVKAKQILVDEDAVKGLRRLGYQIERAREAVSQAMTTRPDVATTQDILRAALKILNS